MPHDLSTTKDDMIRTISDELLSLCGVSANGVLTLIDDKERNIENNKINSLQLIVRCHSYCMNYLILVLQFGCCNKILQ